MKNYYSHGKLLLTGEYVVLDGALSLAIPTRFGQNLRVEHNAFGNLHWTSLDEKGQVWFEETFKITDNGVHQKVKNDNSISNRLQHLLNVTKSLSSDFLNDDKGYKVTTQFEFPKNWGLGTSSTLINNIANWANINPYTLLKLTFGGSGYDVACAEANSPITYTIEDHEILNLVQDDKKIKIQSVNFNPSFKDNLYFVHLNKKQNSRDGIAQYRTNTSDLKQEIEYINGITQEMIHCNSLEQFQKLMDTHEEIISKIVNLKPAKEQLFEDFNGSIKSLGAWGGDFVLAASNDNSIQYFKEKGFPTIIPYEDMILK
ncbi:GYDIA family GHMP kinase [Psychroserpens mesophilus]|uniref:GYDIA family GHMP kinase n=1 Tax=Psychroserpens mesophilus TaxID=325473 RepID=UPI003D66034B